MAWNFQIFLQLRRSGNRFTVHFVNKNHNNWQRSDNRMIQIQDQQLAPLDSLRTALAEMVSQILIQVWHICYFSIYEQNKKAFCLQEDYESFVANNREAVDKVCNRCRSIFFMNRIASSAKKPDCDPVEVLAHKCVSLEFLIKFYDSVVQHFSPTMTVKEVVELIVKPATKVEKFSFIDLMSPGLYVKPTAFVSHAFGNPFQLLVE